MPLRKITSAPPALSREQLAEISASTPASFASIPPLLRHLESDVFWSIEPAHEGLQQAKGTLWVTEECLSFLSDDQTNGMSIPYENITLHALSRAPLPSLSSMAAASGSAETTAADTTHTNGHSNDTSAARAATTTGPCVYCQINEFEDEAADEYEKSWEVMIIPTHSAHFEKIFEALSHCASLHPPKHSGNDGAGPQIAGLDMDSLVYADADGNVHGPGNFDDAAEDEGEDEAQDSRAGAQRSDYVADTRKKPY